MRKILVVLMFLFFAVSAAGFARQTAANEQPSPPPSTTSEAPSEPVEALIEDAFKTNATLFSRHKDLQKYFNAFLPLWKEMFNELQAAQQKATGLEDQFSRYNGILEKLEPELKKLKPPGDFKDFNEAVGKAISDLDDWVVDMKDRIHYATTDYQREAYMKRLEDFQKNWYEEFFGQVVEELNGSLAAYVTWHWMDNLTPQEEQRVRKDPQLFRYLSAYHNIHYHHLKTSLDLAKKARDAQQNGGDDEDSKQDFLNEIRKELKDIQKTKAGMERLSAPPAFKDFQALQLQWLDAMARGTQKFIDIETAIQNHVPQEKIQNMISEKNALDEKAKELQLNADNAYNQALKSSLQ